MMAYTTHCDRNYVTRVLALEKSLRANQDFTTLYVIAHDDHTKVQIESLELKFTRVISLVEVEERFPELVSAKNNRSRLEYIFCLTPFVISYTHLISASDLIIYLDADLYFFKSPNLALEDFRDDADVAIIEHGFQPKFNHLKIYGNFNVGWLAFRMLKNGNSILDWWKSACINSTSTLVSEHVYADQKYLDEFPIRFQGTHINRTRGTNIAPWNIENFLGKNQSETFLEDNLVFFHFSGLRMYGRFVVLGLSGYSLRASKDVKGELYRVYVDALIDAGSRLNLNPQVDSRKYTFKELVKIIYYRDFILR
jgi:hypothetical protein